MEKGWFKGTYLMCPCMCLTLALVANARMCKTWKILNRNCDQPITFTSLLECERHDVRDMMQMQGLLVAVGLTARSCHDVQQLQLSTQCMTESINSSQHALEHNLLQCWCLAPGAAHFMSVFSFACPCHGCSCLRCECVKSCEDRVVQ